MGAPADDERGLTAAASYCFPRHTSRAGNERQQKNALAADGTGYILAPCHNLQSLTPLENILAMYDEAWRYGKR